MQLDTVSDVFPALITATEEGRLKWEVSGTQNFDYIVTIDNYKVEIEAKKIDRDGAKADAIVLYLWNEDGKIIESEQILEGEARYALFWSYMKLIRKVH